MSITGFLVILIIIANIVVSYKGFKSSLFLERYCFRVDAILAHKDYKRLVTSGFLHIDWNHLILNMISLLIFSGAMAQSLGPLEFLLVYFVSLVGGNLLALLIHRNHGDYSAVGASGAVCGVMFASVALYPAIMIGFFLPIPGFLYAIFFVLYSMYGIRSQRDNIGHEAHLGGALLGMAAAVALRPEALYYNYITLLLITVPSVVFIYFIVTRPHVLYVDNFFYKTHKDYYSIDHKYNADRYTQQQEIDRILDKIAKKGMRSLSSKERETLKIYSKKVR